MTIKILDFAKETHAGNVVAGWWTDLHTGESILTKKDRIHLLMLTASELSEASMGFEDKLKDDKLPQFPMLDVEIADAVIRASDLLGAEIKIHNFQKEVFTMNLVNKILNESHFDRIDLRHTTIDIILMKLVNILSISTENYRKNRYKEASIALFSFIFACEKVMQNCPFIISDLSEVCRAKKKYNMTREDHKIENRIKDGGKTT